MVFVDECKGLEVMLLRLRHVPESFGCETEIVPGFVVARVERYRTTERFGRLGVSALLVIDAAEGVRNLHVGWRTRGRALQRLLRFGVASQKIQRLRLHLERRDVLRIFGPNALKRCDCVSWFLRKQLRLAKREEERGAWTTRFGRDAEMFRGLGISPRLVSSTRGSLLLLAVLARRQDRQEEQDDNLQSPICSNKVQNVARNASCRRRAPMPMPKSRPKFGLEISVFRPPTPDRFSALTRSTRISKLR